MTALSKGKKKAAQGVPPSLVSGMLPQVSCAVVGNPHSLAQQAGASTTPCFHAARALLPHEVLNLCSDEEDLSLKKKSVKKKVASYKTKKGKEPVCLLELTTLQV